MNLFRRLRNALREDALALLPGSGIPFSMETLLRALLYGGLMLFLYQITMGIYQRRSEPVQIEPLSPQVAPVLESEQI